MDIFFERMGCKRISYDRVESLDDKIKQGIDGVYECKNPPPKYIIKEAKYDTSQLRTLPNGTKDMYPPCMATRSIIRRNSTERCMMPFIAGRALWMPMHPWGLM